MKYFFYVASIVLMILAGCKKESDKEQTTDTNEDNVKEFVDRYSFVPRRGTDVNESLFGPEMPSYEMIKSEDDNNREELKNYLKDSYDKYKGHEEDITSDSKYEQLKLKTVISSSMVRFYGVTGYYAIMKNLSQSDVEKVEELLDSRKRNIETMLKDAHTMTVDDTYYYMLIDAKEKTEIAELVSYDISSKYNDDYDWNEGIVPYLEKVCK
ncbi:MAG: hypothetical protein HDR94_07915 [Bacteroides sp.]|nr:hypothetical protein [Bacteroides sp.]